MIRTLTVPPSSVTTSDEPNFPVDLASKLELYPDAVDAETALSVYPGHLFDYQSVSRWSKKKCVPPEKKYVHKERGEERVNSKDENGPE